MSGPLDNAPRPASNNLIAAESSRLPSGRFIRLLRWWIPGTLLLLGLIILVADSFNGFGVSAFAAFGGAGSSIWLANFLWRLGVSGDDERDREAEDRVYLARHGHWPDQDQRSAPERPGHS